MKTPRKLWAAVGAGAIILAACGSDSDDATPATEAAEPEATEAPATDPPATDPPATEAPPTDPAPDEVAAGPTPTTFTLEIANVSDGFAARTVDVFAVPVGESEPGPALPGSAYELTFEAAPGERLSFATMFVQSNDWFFAPAADGIALFAEDGTPLTGDITDQVLLWDGATEIDQEPGTGPDQAPRQAGPDTGDADPDTAVRLVEGRNSADYVTVSLTNDGSSFTLLVENVSEGADVPTPLAPGVGVVHAAGEPLCTPGEPDRGDGLEAVAEDGDPTALAAAIVSGVTTPLAPGVAVVTDTGGAFFTPGEPDRDEGLEAVAEDGDPAALAEATAGTAFAVPAGGDEPGPAFPGSSYVVEFEATPGQYLDVATMLVQSNDWFFAPEALALFDGDGTPLSGDITEQFLLWDAGTEVDQEPGVGPDQAPRQAGPDTGDADPDPNVRLVEDRTSAGYIVVTLTPAT